MLKFLGGIISGLITRILIMAMMFGGSALFIKSAGGFGGVAAMITGEEFDRPESGGSLPSVAGLSGFAALLPGMGPKEPTYYSQQARISEIKMVCRLSIVKGGKLNQTQPLECPRARAALSDPQFAGYKMQKDLTATYIYYAMDGVNVHTGNIKLTGRDKSRRVGEVLNIQVNRDNPSQSIPI